MPIARSLLKYGLLKIKPTVLYHSISGFSRPVPILCFAMFLCNRFYSLMDSSYPAEARWFLLRMLDDDASSCRSMIAWDGWLCVQLTAVGRCGVRGRNARRPAGMTDLVVVIGAVTTHYLSTPDEHVTATVRRQHRVYMPSTVPVRTTRYDSICTKYNA